MVSTVEAKSWRELYPFEPKFLEMENGAKMNYLDEGPKDAPVLFMIHGNPTWSFYYRNLVLAFRDKFRCVVPDHIGCGLSDKPQDYNYTLAQRVADISKLADHLNLENITMVVHDWGGAIGMGFAVKNAEKIQRNIVFNTAAFLSERIPFSIAACRWPLVGPFMVRGFNAFVVAAQHRTVVDKKVLKGAIGDGYVAPYNTWANRVAIQGFVDDIPMKTSHQTHSVLKSIDENLKILKDKPMLLVWGNDDFCFNVDFRKEWERRFPDAEVHSLDDASHYVVEEKTKEIIVWMRSFLEE